MKLDWNIVNLIVTILLAIGGFIGSAMLLVLGWLLSRLSEKLDTLNEEIESLKIQIEKRPGHDWIRDEAGRVTRDSVLDHENRLHRDRRGKS